MSTPETARNAAPGAGTLAGAEIIARIRRLIIVAMLAAWGYSLFTVASKGYCPGGITGDGAFLDASGQITDVPPECISLLLKPSPLVFIALAAIVVLTLSAVQRHAIDTASALRYLNRAIFIVLIVAVASAVIARVWFSLIPLQDWPETGTLIYPFPFGAVDMTVKPVTGP